MRTLPILNMTVCFLCKDDARVMKVLLVKKKRKVGKGMLAPHGGKFEEGENGLQCVIREVRTETKKNGRSRGVILDPTDLYKVCIADFHNRKSDGTAIIYRVHFYLAWKWKGKAEESLETGKPKWYDVCSLPYEKMMAADKDYLPQLLVERKKLRVKAWYAKGGQHRLIRKTQIREVKFFKSL